MSVMIAAIKIYPFIYYIALFAAELLDTNTVSDETYERTKQVLDGQDSVLVEITAIIGYYSYVAYTLNVFKIST